MYGSPLGNLRALGNLTTRVPVYILGGILNPTTPSLYGSGNQDN